MPTELYLSPHSSFLALSLCNWVLVVNTRAHWIEWLQSAVLGRISTADIVLMIAYHMCNSYHICINKFTLCIAVIIRPNRHARYKKIYIL